ncbi:hypothetical protein JXL21_06690 [Candidatus Bathyarchaeota archaeon]|nr:hypothetical protein [Candidatus Bathyarchaeota archaeon]
MVESSTILSLIQATGIVVGVAYYILNIENNRRNQENSLRAQEHALETRQAQLFMSLYEKLLTTDATDTDFEVINLELKTIDDWEKLLLDKEKSRAWNWWGAYYEGIGILVHDGFIDISMVARMMSGGIIGFWEKYKDVIHAIRKEYDWPRFSIELEYLVGRVIEYGLEHPELEIKIPTMYQRDDVTAHARPI